MKLRFGTGYDTFVVSRCMNLIQSSKFDQNLKPLKPLNPIRGQMRSNKVTDFHSFQILIQFPVQSNPKLISSDYGQPTLRRGFKQILPSRAVIG